MYHMYCVQIILGDIGFVYYTYKANGKTLRIYALSRGPAHEVEVADFCVL